MLKESLFIAAVLWLAAGACAESVLSVNLEVYRNDSVKVNYIKLENASPTKYVPPGDYRIELEDSEGGALTRVPLSLGYVIMSNPPVLTNSSVINLRIPYKEDTKYLALYRNETNILRQPVETCNSDTICDRRYESHITCPQDCLLSEKDGLCIKEADKTCDPDCEEGIDPDCTTGIQWFSYVLYFLAALVVLVVLAYYFHNEIENRKVEKQRREFLKWKKEHA
jgi:hypothetical protein